MMRGREGEQLYSGNGLLLAGRVEFAPANGKGKEKGEMATEGTVASPLPSEEGGPAAVSDTSHRPGGTKGAPQPQEASLRKRRRR